MYDTNEYITLPTYYKNQSNALTCESNYNNISVVKF